VRPGRLEAVAVLLAPLLLGALPLLAGAQAIPCGDGVELRLSTSEPRQGALVLLEVPSATSVMSIRATWQGEALQSWREADGTWRSLLGVDVETPAGAHPLSLELALAQGGRAGCAVSLSVRDGSFKVEHLTVEERFVELSAKDRRRARQEARRLRKIFTGVSADRLWQAAFQAPLEGFSASGNFGMRRVLNGQPRSPHTGEDFPAPKGAPVRAPQAGVVVLAEDLFYSGKTVVLDHGLGLFSWYGHLDTISARKGQRVEAGKLLGGVGATGRVTGPHLHWGARLGKSRVNPLDLLELGRLAAERRARIY